MKLLLVDDDAELCAMLQEYFENAGHVLECAHEGRTGLVQALNGSYDLTILDVMLPLLSGLEVLTQLRRRRDLPVILLTAKGRRPDRIAGLDSGADDYLAKPFDPDELLARIRAVLRRSASLNRTGAEVFTVGPIRIDAIKREALLDGEMVDLTSTEFDLLEMLSRSSGRVLSREEMAAALFGREVNPYDRFLDVHMSHLRTKLGCSQSLIRTVRGVGYVFAAST